MKADFRGSKTDHTHTEYFSYLLAIYHIPPEFLAIENNLINGHMSFNCSIDPNEPNCSNNATMSHLTFETGKTHLLRLINAGGAGNQKFSRDERDLVVIANDFVPAQPYTTKVVTLGEGQRSDILVRATGRSNDAVWMRAELDVLCLNVMSMQPNATAPIYYSEADTSRLPTSSGAIWELNNCANVSILQSHFIYTHESTNMCHD